jgi:hypothetical protein
MSALQSEGRAVLQAYVEEAAQLRAERGALRGELQAAAVASKLAATMMNEERNRLQREVNDARAQAEAALVSLNEAGGENSSVKLQAEGTKNREAQKEVLSQLETIGGYRERLLELKEHEREETGSSFAEVRAMREELHALRHELKERQKKDPKKMASLRMQIREFHVTCAQLERERSNLMRRATNAEQQLETLEAKLAANLLKYQKELVRLQAQVNEAGGNKSGRSSRSDSRPPTGGGAPPPPLAVGSRPVSGGTPTKNAPLPPPSGSRPATGGSQGGSRGGSPAAQVLQLAPPGGGSGSGAGSPAQAEVPTGAAGEGAVPEAGAAPTLG